MKELSFPLRRKITRPSVPLANGIVTNRHFRPPDFVLTFSSANSQRCSNYERRTSWVNLDFSRSASR